MLFICAVLTMASRIPETSDNAAAPTQKVRTQNILAAIDSQIIRDIRNDEFNFQTIDIRLIWQSSSDLHRPEIWRRRAGES